MSKLLLRLFVKNYRTPDAPGVHTAIGSMAGVTGIICNVLLFALKLIVGLLSGAVSIVADALNNLSDAASSVVTLLGFRMARRPADPDHPYGHARYEYLSGLVVAALIFVIGLELGGNAVKKIFYPKEIQITGLTVAVLLISMAVKLWLSRFYTTLGKQIHSKTLKASGIDSRNDVIASGAVLAGCLAEAVFSVPVDGYLGLAVAAFILWSGIGVARETVSPLLGERADQALLDKIGQLISANPKVLGYHDLLVHDYGPGQCYASVHVELSATEDPLVCHDIIDDLEWEILQKLNVHLVIHYDPVLENDAQWNKMRQLTEDIIKELDPTLSMHGFRIVPGAAKPKLVFDLAVPYGKKHACMDLKTAIDKALQDHGVSYTTVIRFDDKA